MKRRVWLMMAVIATLALVVGYFSGFVGIRYPKVIEEEPLDDPQVVTLIEGNRIELQDGRVFEVQETNAGESWPLSDAEQFQLIDVEPLGREDEFILYANREGWVCGTPWARTIVIPIIGETVYKNRREMIALARDVTEEPEFVAKFYRFDFDFFQKLRKLWNRQNPNEAEMVRIDPRGLLEVGGITLDEGDSFIHMLGRAHHHLIYRDSPDKIREFEKLYGILMGFPIEVSSRELYNVDALLPKSKR